MQSLRETDADTSESLVLVGIALDLVLEESCKYPSTCQGGKMLTAMGFANVLTAREVILSVSDMLGLSQWSNPRLNYRCGKRVCRRESGSLERLFARQESDCVARYRILLITQNLIFFHCPMLQLQTEQATSCGKAAVQELRLRMSEAPALSC